ncbi:monooxygenase [Pusillimonas sp. T2]|uniref:FAD-dependent monooxygenase n=1 Tax=Pusillimonas sp. T2 TaxID=1548123 RepID=UPI000B9D27AD|nr:FAD-dependent monooxygenase [Pusillimonas sp. T2]OXR49479.1 monooxygenase [Pusillimonas sp. T2]
MNTNDKNIAIVGAGIGGLTLALALLQKGYKVNVYEQAHELKELGAGIQMAPNGTRILRHLGLEEALLQKGAVPAAGKEVRLWNTGQTWPLFDLGADSIRRFGTPYWMVHRGDLHSVLLSAVQALSAGAVHTNHRLVSIAQDASNVTMHFANGEVASAKFLIGADGVHSVVRNQLFDEHKSEFTGIVAWRGLAPMEELDETLKRNVGTNWIGPGGHCITYPVQGGKVLNFVGLVERNDWQKESWTDAGTTEECAADFPGWHPLIHSIIDKLDTPFRWALLKRAPLKRWTSGRVTLLGDACHPTLPFLAQGAIMALEDSIVLARCLETYGEDFAGAFARYEELRIPRTSAIVNGSSANISRFHNPILAEADKAAAYVTREWDPEQVRQRYDWLFEYDAVELAI